METTQDIEQAWFPYEPLELPIPGGTLRETLEHLEMSQSKLASRTGLTLKHVNQIMTGKAAITPTTAIALERATGVAAVFWNRLEADYQDHQLRANEEEALRAQSEWLDRMPVKELRARGHVTANRRDPGRLLQEVLTFFGVGTIGAFEASWDRPAAAFLQSGAYKIDPGAVSAWLRLGELAAGDLTQSTSVEPFNRAALKAALPLLRPMTVLNPEEFYPQLVSLCAQVGVALVIVPDVSGTRASGASRFISPDRAVVQLSNRGKRNDKFWFALFHELGHLILHSKKDTFMRFEDLNPSGEGVKVEQEANDFAGKFLIPEEFEDELLSIKSAADARSLASKIGVAPGIVAGRFQRETGNWTFGSSLFEKYVITD